MKSKILIALMVLTSIAGVQTAQAGLFSKIANFFGVKEDSTIGQLAKTADEIGNAVVAKKVNDTLTKYGGEQINSYNEWAAQYNENQDRKVQQYLSEVDQYKMDYCKAHGLYDFWYAEYGDDWFNRAGRSWFDSQDEYTERRTGERILPWHLRDSAEVVARANANKTDGSLTNVVLGAFGLSDSDARRAEEWKEADKYGKRDIIIDQTFNVISAGSKNKDMVDAFRQIAKTNNHYLKDKSNPETSGVAMSNMVMDLSNIVFDTYTQGVENRKAYLAEKLQVRKMLEEKGLDPSYAKEVSGTVLSIQNNNELTEHEKTEWLRLLGFYGNEGAVLEEAQTVSNMSEDQANNLLREDQKKKEEKERLKREEQLRKERKERERNEAIDSINSVIVDSYIINKIDLNDNQKEVMVNLIEILNNRNDLTLEIIGYTCDLGTETTNEKIGMARAEKVKEYLIESGISEERISISTVGENEPVVENTNAQNRLKNRRVTFSAK